MLTNRTMDMRMKEFEAEALPYRTYLERTASAVLRNRAEAEDVVQELYLCAWQSFDRFTPGTNCRAWLYKILFHVIAHRRRQWFGYRADRTLVALDEIQTTLVYEPPLPETLRDQELLAAVRTLPARFAAVLLLADVHEFSYQEIRAALGIPLGTVMSRLSRARRLMRAQLTAFSTTPNTAKTATA